jgi:hypothetical protein
MDAKTLKSVVDQIHRRFPEFSGVKPKVTKHGSASQAHLAKSGPTYLLTFHSSNRTSAAAESKTISRWVRVVVTEQGKIMKVSTSR